MIDMNLKEALPKKEEWKFRDVTTLPIAVLICAILRTIHTWQLYLLSHIENSCSFLFSFKPFRIDDAYHCTLFPIKHKLKYLFTLAAFGGHFSCFFGMGAISNDNSSWIWSFWTLRLFGSLEYSCISSYAGTFLSWNLWHSE